MKELWVKKTVWQRHLIKNNEIEEVKLILANNTQQSYDIIVDCYDKGNQNEFDNDELFLPGKSKMHTMEIRNEDGQIEWTNI